MPSRLAPPLAASLAALSLAACATSRSPAAPEPVVTAEPANARVKLYADCVAAAVAQGGLQRYGRYIWYTCRGPAAQALFDASETFVRTRNLERAQGGRTTRQFTRRENDDRCWSQVGFAETTFWCELTQPVGAFLDPAQDAVPPPSKR